jgi:hypothetical protein
MDQKGHDKDMPNRQSTMEKAEGSRDPAHSDTQSSQHGAGSRPERAREQGAMEQNRGSRERNGDDATGITNRGVDREQEEQRHVPERGSSRSEK